MISCLCFPSFVEFVYAFLSPLCSRKHVIPFAPGLTDVGVFVDGDDLRKSVPKADFVLSLSRRTYDRVASFFSLCLCCSRCIVYSVGVER